MIIFGEEIYVRSDSVIPEISEEIRKTLDILKDLSRSDYNFMIEKYMTLVAMLKGEISDAS